MEKSIEKKMFVVHARWVERGKRNTINHFLVIDLATHRQIIVN